MRKCSEALQKGINLGSGRQSVAGTTADNVIDGLSVTPVSNHDVQLQQLPFQPEVLQQPVDFSFEAMFLEDTLLLQNFAYNHSGLTEPSTPTHRAQVLPALPPTGLDALQAAVSDAGSPARADRSVHDALQITAADLQGFHANLDRADPAGDLQDFRRPTLSRTLRCLIAYFQHYDLHTPIVHFASFKISDAHPSLVLIMIAIGAAHLSENKFAESAYESCCILLAQHDKAMLRAPNPAFQLWYAQAAILAAQYGACTGETELFYRAQQHLGCVQTAIYRSLPELHTARGNPVESWAAWIFLESCSRIISWMFIISSMLLALDHYSTAILPPMPCSMPAPSDESAWHAVSELEWKIAMQTQITPDTDLWTIAQHVMCGQTPPADCGRISAFTLLALIGAILATICTRQRLTVDTIDQFRIEHISKMEKAIFVWEALWRSHPRTERNMARLDDPLLNDCLSLLGSANYHLYLNDELHTLKKIADNPNADIPLPVCSDKASCHKVIKFATNSWLVRAKLGITYLNKTGGLSLALKLYSQPTKVPALILAWWLHIEGNIVPRSGEALLASTQDAAGAAAIQRMFEEILSELDEQGIYYDESGNPALSPIDFYVSVLDGRVWKCATTMETRLRNFATRLKSEV
ncbi:uncharacterized protein AB675_5498 [Cyphellophora attinorum]|uniref:Xylanolytic transcriptional activator regulatory domain-containing protein n=1 Tax=Cyphellophora attinorum TaxID=1664694 RepID=A0A0N1HBV2_9EURO|nr:uncharacterized protein AB675_5498 [Phialophora attinorum]KPI41947.1 hypothetical protein AB675_5498 [Phialophora attinorum]